jgi:hypothetical protein
MSGTAAIEYTVLNAVVVAAVAVDGGAAKFEATEPARRLFAVGFGETVKGFSSGLEIGVGGSSEALAFQELRGG